MRLRKFQNYWYGGLLLLGTNSALLLVHWHFREPVLRPDSPLPPDIAAAGLILYFSLVAFAIGQIIASSNDFRRVPAIASVLLVAILLFVLTNNAYQWILTDRTITGWQEWWGKLLIMGVLFFLVCGLLADVWFSGYRLWAASTQGFILLLMFGDILSSTALIQNLLANESFMESLFLLIFIILALLLGWLAWDYFHDRQKTKPKSTPVNDQASEKPPIETPVNYRVTYGMEIPAATGDKSRAIGQTRWPAMISITDPPESGAAPMLADLLCQHWDMGSKGQRVLLTTDWLTLVELAHRIETERLTGAQVFIPQGKRPYGYDPIGAVNHQPEQWAERLRHWLGAPIGESPEEKRLAHLLYFAALLAYEGAGETVALADVAEALHNETQRQTWLAQSQPDSAPWEATPLTRLAVNQFWERTFPGWPAAAREQLMAQAKQMLAPYRLPDTAVPDWPLTGKSDWPLTAVPFTWVVPDTEPCLIAIYLPPTCGQLALDWSKALLSDIARRGTPPLVAWADPAGRFSPAEMADWLRPFQEQASSLIQVTPPKRELRAWWGTKRDWALVQFTTVQHRFWPGRHVARIGWMEWVVDRPQEKPARSSWRMALRTVLTAMAQRWWPLYRPQDKPARSSWEMVFHTVSTAMAQRPRQLYHRDPLAGLRHQLAYATPAEREARRQALLQPDSDLTPFDKRQLLLAGWGQL
jgi:hypothetical protein